MEEIKKTYIFKKFFMGGRLYNQIRRKIIFKDMMLI